MVDLNVAPVLSGEIRYGSPDGVPDVRILGGFFIVDSPDAHLLVSMLPSLLHLRALNALPRWCA
jgi:hypothetical protein